MAIVKSLLSPVPLEKEPFGERLLNSFWNNAIKNPGKKAMICAENYDQYVTWKDMYLSSLCVETFLKKHGFGHGDVAALVLPNCWEFLQILVGAALRGGAVSGASTLFTDYELQRQFYDSKSKIIFTSDMSLNRVLKAVKQCPTVRLIVVINISNRSKQLLNDNLPFGVINYSDVLRIQPDINKNKIDIIVERDLLLLPYSSGTTGSPKGVMINHQNFSTMMSIFQEHYLKYFYPKAASNWNWDKENILLSLPFYHIYGIGLLMQSALRGQTAIIMKQFDKERYLKIIQDYRIRMLYLVPPIMVILANDPIVQKYDLSSLEFILSGAAPGSKEIIQKLWTILPNLKRIDQAYGMTECSMATSIPVSFEDMPENNCGKLLSNFEMKVINPMGKTLKLGEVGELCIRSPTIMMGYLGKPQSTAECIDDEGWYHTGDVARIDEKGYIFVIDRIKEFIKVKGYQVAPSELEDILLSHPDIQDAGVVGIVDELSGEIPMAYVVRKNNKLTVQDIKDFVAKKTAPYKHLKYVKFIQEIPKSAAGKILRRFLRDQARNEQKQSKL